MKLARTGAIIVVLLFVALVALLALKTQLPGPSPEIESLKPVEVRDYEGTPLSSIADFRENSIKGPQRVDRANYTLAVDGLVRENKTFTYDEVIGSHARYRKMVTLYCVEGWDVTILWDGVLVRDLIDEAGADPGATSVVFYAADGYSTSLPLGYVRDRDILMAYAMNNVTLPAERGFPFQLVAEDRWGYKWIKWITRIELTNLSYYGYWESRGYSNSGDLNRSFLA
jgi:DMSO/TMAO reductase YedYZ molybdopterin-dependent catalytic subunit